MQYWDNLTNNETQLAQTPQQCCPHHIQNHRLLPMTPLNIHSRTQTMLLCGGSDIPDEDG